MNDLRCLIVDDEPLALDVVLDYLQRLGIRSVTTADNGIDAFRQLQRQPFDLLFLDMEMPQFTGFDLLKTLQNRPPVIVTTAYRDYAVEGFEWEVIDYLVKPFSFARFLQSMDKAARTIRQPRPDDLTPPPATYLPDEKDFLFLKTDRQWVRVEIATVRYIESLRDYIRVFTTTRDYLCHQSLTAITAKLPPERFLRVHRSYTIALDRVDHIRQHCAYIGDTAIPIARAFRPEVYRRLGR